MSLLILAAASPPRPALTIENFWPVLVLYGIFLAFTLFASYMAIKQEDEDRKAGRPKRPPPDPGM
jgi:hypothetical protein